MVTKWNKIVQPTKGDVRAITPVTGTTTNSYVDAVDLDTRWLDETILTIANTAGSNQMDYQVLVYNDYAAGIAYATTTNTVAVNDEDQVILRRHARVKVQVKSTSSGSHTTFQIDSISGRM